MDTALRASYPAVASSDAASPFADLAADKTNDGTTEQLLRDALDGLSSTLPDALSSRNHRSQPKKAVVFNPSRLPSASSTPRHRDHVSLHPYRRPSRDLPSSRSASSASFADDASDGGCSTDPPSSSPPATPPANGKDPTTGATTKSKALCGSRIRFSSSSPSSSSSSACLTPSSAGPLLRPRGILKPTTHPINVARSCLEGTRLNANPYMIPNALRMREREKALVAAGGRGGDASGESAFARRLQAAGSAKGGRKDLVARKAGFGIGGTGQKQAPSREGRGQGPTDSTPASERAHQGSRLLIDWVTPAIRTLVASLEPDTSGPSSNIQAGIEREPRSPEIGQVGFGHSGAPGSRSVPDSPDSNMSEREVAESLDSEDAGEISSTAPSRLAPAPPRVEVTLRDVEQAYDVLLAKFRVGLASSSSQVTPSANACTDVSTEDRAWNEAEAALDALRRHAPDFVRCMSRDIGRLFDQPESSSSKSGSGSASSSDAELSFVSFSNPRARRGAATTAPSKKRGQSAAEIRRKREEMDVAHAAIKWLGLVFWTRRLWSCFTETDLSSLLSQLLLIPYAPVLSCPNPKKTYGMAIWALQTQHLPLSVLSPHANRLIGAIVGALGPLSDDPSSSAGNPPAQPSRISGNWWGSLSVRAEATLAVHSLALAQPSLILPRHAQFLPRIIQTLWHPSSATLRAKAAVALGACVEGARRWVDDAEREVREAEGACEVAIQRQRQGEKEGGGEEEGASGGLQEAERRKLKGRKELTNALRARDELAISVGSFLHRRVTSRPHRTECTTERGEEITRSTPWREVHNLEDQLLVSFPTECAWSIPAWASLIALVGAQATQFAQLNTVLRILQRWLIERQPSVRTLVHLAWNHAIYAFSLPPAAREKRSINPAEAGMEDIAGAHAAILKPKVLRLLTGILGFSNDLKVVPKLITAEADSGIVAGDDEADLVATDAPEAMSGHGAEERGTNVRLLNVSNRGNVNWDKRSDAALATIQACARTIVALVFAVSGAIGSLPEPENVSSTNDTAAPPSDNDLAEVNHKRLRTGKRTQGEGRKQGQEQEQGQGQEQGAVFVAATPSAIISSPSPRGSLRHAQYDQVFVPLIEKQLGVLLDIVAADEAKRTAWDSLAALFAVGGVEALYARPGDVVKGSNINSKTADSDREDEGQPTWNPSRLLVDDFLSGRIASMDVLGDHDGLDNAALSAAEASVRAEEIERWDPEWVRVNADRVLGLVVRAIKGVRGLCDDDGKTKWVREARRGSKVLPVPLSRLWRGVLKTLASSEGQEEKDKAKCDAQLASRIVAFLLHFLSPSSEPLLPPSVSHLQPELLVRFGLVFELFDVAAQELGSVAFSLPADSSILSDAEAVGGGPVSAATYLAVRLLRDNPSSADGEVHADVREARFALIEKVSRMAVCGC